jgi:hypothetical protein
MLKEDIKGMAFVNGNINKIEVYGKRKCSMK